MTRAQPVLSQDGTGLSIARGDLCRRGEGGEEPGTSQPHPSIAVTLGYVRAPLPPVTPRMGLVPLQRGPGQARPAQLIFHVVKFPLLPVKIQAWMILGGADHPPQCLRLRAPEESWNLGPQYCGIICPRAIQLCEWALGILERGWGALREECGSLGAELRLCPRGGLWDPTSSPSSVIPRHRRQGTRGAGQFLLDFLVGCFWGFQTPFS